MTGLITKGLEIISDSFLDVLEQKMQGSKYSM